MNRLLFAALVVAACGKHDTSPPPRPDLELLAPGAEPRHVMFYALSKGAKTTFEIASDVSVKAGDMGNQLPTVAVTVELVVDDVLPDGKMRIHTTFTDAVARERPEGTIPAAALNAQLDLLKGIKITSTLSADGRMSDVKVDPGGNQLPPALDQQISTLTANVEQLAMPLPKAAIGVGAKWTTVRQLQQAGLAMTATSQVEVTSIQGTTIGFAMTSQLAGRDQTVALQGTSIDLKHLDGTATGKGTLDLAKLAVNLEVTQQFAANMATSGEDTAMKSEIKTTITPR